MADIAEDDIHADIRAALAGPTEGIEAPASIPEPKGDEAPDLSNLGVEDKPGDTRARDEAGKFAKASDKPPEAAQPTDITAQAPGTESPAAGDITVPRSLSPEAKAQFATWPELAKAEFLRREADTAKGVDKLQQELRTVSERYQPLDAVLAPHREKWQLQGMGETQAIQTLLAAQDMLERDPTQAIQYLARVYGAKLNAPDGTPAPQADPQVQALTKTVQTLEQRLQAQDQASQSQRFAETQSTIETFASDPKNVYFDNVRPEMAKFLESGAAQSLDQAYQMAIWSNETIRPLMLAAQQQSAAAETLRRQQQQTEQARQAGGSIAGSPGPGSSSTSDVDPSSSIEDDVRRSIQQIAGRV